MKKFDDVYYMYHVDIFSTVVRVVLYMLYKCNLYI